MNERCLTYQELRIDYWPKEEVIFIVTALLTMAIILGYWIGKKWD